MLMPVQSQRKVVAGRLAALKKISPTMVNHTNDNLSKLGEQ